MQEPAPGVSLGETPPDARLLAAISAVESGNDDHAVSPKGARGRYQIMPGTWADMTDEDIDRSEDPAVSEKVALKYINWIRATVERNAGRPATREEVLAAWNGGVYRLLRVDMDVSRMPEETRDFVARVTAVCGEE